MTIEEVRTKKKALELAIGKLVEEFETETGVEVVNPLTYDPAGGGDGEATVSIKVVL